MKKSTRRFTGFLAAVVLLTSSCELLNQVVGSIDPSGGKLTTEQVVQGLKEALKIGTDIAVKNLNKTDGYYLDNLVRINLPPETREVVEYAKRVTGLDKLIEDVVLRINRSAEDAVIKAAPIFSGAITSMTISDAWGILNGADSAATHYLRVNTYNRLFDLYKPSVKASLDKPIVAGVSASETWTQITGRWNQFANSAAGRLLQVKALNYSLDEYVTHQALRGLFIKVQDQEKKIRTDVSARTTDLLRKVFGQV
ncbi:MAG: DUF4197 domain-containing protein [Bacteroidales bacterium]